MSIHKTRPIGEIFEYNGVKLKVVEGDTCRGCYFRFEIQCIYPLNVRGHCGASDRVDRKNVKFKLID